jgi:hypothetical protein
VFIGFLAVIHSIPQNYFCCIRFATYICPTKQQNNSQMKTFTIQGFNSKNNPVAPIITFVAPELTDAMFMQATSDIQLFYPNCLTFQVTTK